MFFLPRTTLGSLSDDFINGTTEDDITLGLDGNDTLFGGKGDDELVGARGNDSLVGSVGDDTLLGGDQADTLVGGAGADRMDGGTGADLVDYSTSPQVSPVFGVTGVFVNLATGAGALGDAQGDTYVDVENIRGSAFNDMLIGTDFSNRIDGGAGNDSIMGNFGADTLIGGAGHNLVSYDDSDAPVTVDLFLNLALGGDAAGDQISGFQDVVGSDFADNLFGSEDANLMMGGGGADLIEGDGGRDTLVGGAGNDTLSGFNDSDSLFGGANSDTFRFDVLTIVGEHGADTVQDFNVNEDRLLFDGLGLVSLGDLNFTQVGANTLITYDFFEGSVTLNNVNVNDLLAHANTAIGFD